MIDKLSNQSRIIIATVLSFLFFAIYNHFFIPKQEVSTKQETQLEKSVKTTAPTSLTTPVESSKIPTITTHKKEEIIATVIADKYEIKIDRLGRINKFYLRENKYKDENGERIQLIDSELAPYPLEIRFCR